MYDISKAVTFVVPDETLLRLLETLLFIYTAGSALFAIFAGRELPPKAAELNLFGVVAVVPDDGIVD